MFSLIKDPQSSRHHPLPEVNNSSEDAGSSQGGRQKCSLHKDGNLEQCMAYPMTLVLPSPHFNLLCFHLTNMENSHYQFYGAAFPLCAGQNVFSWVPLKEVLGKWCHFTLQWKEDTIPWQNSSIQLKRNYCAVTKPICNYNFKNLPL